MAAEKRLVWDSEKGKHVEPKMLSTKVLAKNKQRQSKPGHFLRGPIPMTWLERAAHLPGKALNVGLSIWYVRGLKRSNTFKLKRSTLDRFGVSRYAYYSALQSLEEAGLIAVDRKSGSIAEITVLLEFEPGDTA